MFVHINGSFDEFEGRVPVGAEADQIRLLDEELSGSAYSPLAL